MSGTKSWMLGAAMAAGVLGMGATAVQAAEWGYHQRGPAAYVPPCPGAGYVWIEGSMAGGYWMPGRWEFRRAEALPSRIYGGTRGGDRDRRWEYGWGRDGQRWRR